MKINENEFNSSARDVLTELNAYNFPGCRKRRSTDETCTRGYSAALVNFRPGATIELWHDLWCGKPTYYVGIHTGSAETLEDIISERPEELQPALILVDADVSGGRGNRYGVLNPKAIRRLERRVVDGDFIREDYVEDASDHWLGVYMPIEKFSTKAVLNICQRLAGLSVAGHVSFLEGQRTEVRQSAYERNDVARAACIGHYGNTYSCEICQINFSLKYGKELGDKFIHVHHINPVAHGGKRRTDPSTDLIPVCPNCHAMLHRENPPIEPTKLRKILKGKV